MINKVVFTVTPIFSIPPKSAAAVESWMYNVAKRLEVENKIICICNDGYSTLSPVNKYSSIERIKFGKIYTRIFKKWTRLDPYSYADRILSITHKFINKKKDHGVIFVHNNIKLFKKIIKKEGYQNVVLHMHNYLEPTGLPDDIKLIVPSHVMAKWFREHLPKASIEVVRNGFDADIYDTKPEISRHDLGLSKNDKIILFAGRINVGKGILELMQSCNTFFKHNQNFKLVIVGDPDTASKGENAIYQNSVKQFAKNLGKQCIFTGNIQPEKMHHYYSIADLVAVPSIVNEAFCMVALEAMASGCPVIVSRRGGMVEFVHDRQTGFLFREPLTIESMAQDLEDALATVNIAEIAAQGRQHVYENFTWEIVTKELQHVIDKWYL